MKIRPTIYLLIASLSFVSLSTAQPAGSAEEAPAPNRQKGKKPPHNTESRLLQHFLSMDKAELAKIRQTLERIEKMSPEERASLRRRMKDMDAADPAKIEAMRQYYTSMPKETREAMRQRWDAMTPEEKADWRRRLRDLSPVGRLEVFEKEGFLPGGRPRHKPGGEPGRAKPSSAAPPNG